MSAATEITKACISMDDTNDLRLWKAIVQRRDREAFVQLYHRHEKAAYNLAYHITRNRDEAEEALQEAMVRVWKSAHSFRGEGSIRSWFLRIVARESLRKISSRREDRKEAAAMGRHERIQFSEAEAAVERDEMLALLRKQVETLPGVERELLALHFGGGLSQEEIGEALNFTQQNVSMRIKKALERLRTNLTAAGMAAALPLIETGGLCDSFQTGYAVPPGVSAKTMTHFSQAAQESMRRGAVAASSSKSATAVIVVLFACAVGAGSLYWLSRGGATPATAPTPRNAVPPATGTEIKTAQEPKLSQKWTFDKGPAEELKIVNGASWKWSPGDANTPPMMVPPSETHVLIMLPMTVPARPIRITGRTRLMPGTMVGAQAIWSDGDRQVDEKKVWSTTLTMNYTNAPMLLNIYLFNQWEVVYLGERLWAVLEHSKPYPGNRLILGIQNCRLEELEIRELTFDEIPAHIRQTETLITKARFKHIDRKPDGK
jgi:RNA polymerase sigma-70 factor, ECF subfamily